jgi:hypothetical protein
MEATISCKTPVTIYQPTDRNIPEDIGLNQHRYDKLKSCTSQVKCQTIITGDPVPVSRLSG